MAKIAYILLCHKDPKAIVAQARRLTAAGDFVSIHFDGRADPADFAAIRDALDGNPGVAFAAKRYKCGWGAWSLVAASLSAVETAFDSFPRATHFYMVSGDCMPIKSAAYCHQFLDRDSCDYIESHDFFRSDWIKTGFKEERLIYRHPFNERTQAKLFYATYEVQRRLNITRKVPADIQIMIGSQWWCLRRDTIEKVLSFCRTRRDVMRFFRTTWIPDETFFQTVVRHVVPHNEIRNRTPTFLIFSDYGMPVSFYDDHYDLLLAQNYLFARKISPEAHELKARLGDLYNEDRSDFPLSGEGRRLHAFLTGRGREGRRFAPRFWEREASLGFERDVLMIVCKKWHVAKRLAQRIREQTGVPTVGYLFNEMDANLPDLGGIEKTVEKRHRHRRALLRLLMEYNGDDRLVICLDPADLDLMRDFEGDRCTTRILELDCEFSDDYLIGHAQRLGLIGADVPPMALERLMPTVRADIRHEREAIRDAGFESLIRIEQADDTETRAAAIRAFLKIDADKAGEIAGLPYLFQD
ncbi:Core-2/I-Branching enzyme [Rhodobacteraceae bacterium THAF1]|uniref:DUF5928 domain-containing protein n=1 Tax=Palleronia sp. THAF1 TaxID=2587842 RepID=UPI000F417397|nr:DUF5928 domain-containing protein [Palleronia sp. THAF1]QFU07481.1 Core-2/I-Branching enzyme [Palleronia sp. THAF1]VDC20420.1 Core-2/I-Branching enzyme [Rhodobacteraceae bacterium THAF1]